MNGIEKIIQQIDADAKAESDQILAAAQAQADAITADYAKQAEKIAAEGVERGKAAAAQREERLASVAAMEGRKALLAAKQEMMTKAFDLALDKLCTLPDEEYVTLLAKLACSIVTTGKEQMIFSQKDRARVGKAVVTAVNNAFPGGGSLTLSEQTRPICGGFILSDGDVEVNCAFETLVRLQRGEIAGEVSKVLFD